MDDRISVANDFIDFISQSPTKYHAIDNVKQKLLQNSYQPLFLDKTWELEAAGKYFIEQDNSALIAFLIGENHLTSLREGIRLICAHTDSPSFKVKPNADIKNPDGYMRLNIQSYAWPILSTWFDRPLSLAGRVALKDGNSLRPKVVLIDVESPILIIPNNAFHLTKCKESNGISKQKEMLPILGIGSHENLAEGVLKQLIAKKLNVNAEDILECELFLYPVERGRIVGFDSDFIVAPRQDDLIMVYSAIQSLISSYAKYDCIKMVALFDAEEETNSTVGGADSPFLRNVLTKIVKSLKGDTEDLISLINNSFAVSLDSAFAKHPNYSESYDLTCAPIMNKGVTIKYDANMHYATTALTSAMFQNICNRNNIPLQKDARHSDLRGGGTISAFLQTQVEMKCVELGIPTWAVHSAYESCGSWDLYYLIKALVCFYNEDEK